MRKKPLISFSKEYITFACAVVILILITCIVIGLLLQSSDKKQRQQTAITEARQLNNSLSNTFKNTNLLLNNIGRQIIKVEESNLQGILEIFNQSLKDFHESNDILSWSLFDWVDRDNMQRLSSKSGIPALPVDMSFRDYITKGIASPWQLHVSEPALGVPSHVWIIPAGIGIRDLKNNHLGIISFGFNIVGLSDKISKSLTYPNIRFLIIDRRGNIVLGSNNMLLNRNQNFFKIAPNVNFNSDSQLLSPPLIIHGTAFFYYEKMLNYPYIILTGYESNYLHQAYIQSLLPRILELLLIGSFFIVLLFFFYKRVVNPITVLAECATNLSRGKLDFVIPKYHTKEMRSLSKALVRIRWFIKTEKAFKQQLEYTNNQLKQLSINKTNLISLTSHELRGPLTVVDANAQIIMQEMYGPISSKYLECASDIREASQELNLFVDDLLDEMKAEAGFYPIEIGRVHIPSLINRAVKLNIGRAHRAHITLEQSIEDGLPRLVGDIKRLRQVLNNLLSNGIKYSHDYSTIKIKAFTHKDGAVEIRVEDQGFGMTQDELQVALSQFGTIINPNSDKVESIGLGLPLCKLLVEQHGAEFIIDTEKWRGSNFRIVFPKEKVLE